MLVVMITRSLYIVLLALSVYYTFQMWMPWLNQVRILRLGLGLAYISVVVLSRGGHSVHWSSRVARNSILPNVTRSRFGPPLGVLL